MLSVVENPGLLGVADEVNARLGRVLDGLAANSAQFVSEVE